MSDWGESGLLLSIGLTFIILAVAVPIGIANEEQTKQEAIKAGLVQNDRGHWVRPELESLVND